MEPRPAHTFDGFRLEPPPGGLWRGDVRLALRPRSLAMLRYLVAQAGRLVTKAELRQHVWGGVHVTDTVLRVSVQEIRAALGDAAAAPQYLETVAQQGYRFRVGGVTEDLPPRTAGPIVGRQQAVARLESGYGARAGEIAAQLARHFERGGEVARAVRFLQQASDNAIQRHAYHSMFKFFCLDRFCKT